METIIQKIENLITDVHTDTTRKALPKLCIELINLSKLYGENKKGYVEYKTKYNIQFTQKKDELKRNYETEGKKITISELDNQVELQLIEILEKKSEYESNVAYLDTLIKSYYEFINSIKFVDKENRQTSNMINNINDEPF